MNSAMNAIVAKGGSKPAFVLFTTIAAAAVLGTVPAAADTPARVRGTVVAIVDDHITIKERSGQIYDLRLGPNTRYADVVRAALDEIKLHEFLGTAVKGSPGRWIAVETVIVPESMRPGRVGYYAWDPLPDTSGIYASDITATGVTIGSVSGIASTAPALTDTSMTNGSVTGIKPAETGRVLTMNLVGNKTAEITVSTAAPVTRFVPVERSMVSVGSMAVVWTSPGNKAALVAVGRGITPPM